MLLAIFFTFNMLFFALGNEEPNYTSDMTDEALSKEYQKSRLGAHPIGLKYYDNILYVGMPEGDFVGRFTKNTTYEGTARPYIFKKVKNIYYITFPNLPYLRENICLISRITFLNGKLIKSEFRHMNEPPFMWYSYSDDTEYLRGNQKLVNSFEPHALPESSPERLSSLSEGEFLNQIKIDTFFHIIKEQKTKVGNIYIIQGRNKKKWRLIFNSEGTCIEQESLW